MGKVDQAALVGGISIGAFTIIFLGFVYCCMVRRHGSKPRGSAQGKDDMELGRHDHLSHGKGGGGSDDLETTTTTTTTDLPPPPGRYRLPQTLRREYRIEVPQPIYAPAPKGLEPTSRPLRYPAAVGSRGDGSARKNSSNRFTPSPFPFPFPAADGGGPLAAAVAAGDGDGVVGGVEGGSRGLSRGRYSG